MAKWWVLLAVLFPISLAGAAPEIPRSLPDGYLVLPFENRSGVQNLEWMRVALPGALVEKLEGHPGLRAVYGRFLVPEGPPPATSDEGAIAKIAGAKGAKLVFTGSYRRPNWRLEITLRLWHVDKGNVTRVGEMIELGDFGETFAMLDRMMLALCAAAGRSPSEEAAQRIQRVPTRDHYAFTLWGRGLLAVHGLGAPSNLVKAVKDLERAVFIDPKYAEAHRLLALAYDEKGQGARAQGQREYALQLRPEYYAPLAELVKQAAKIKKREEGIALAERALSIRPWDLEIRFLLGSMHWEEGNVDDAYKELKRVVDHKPDDLSARRVLVLVHAIKGAKEELAKELEEIIALDPGDEAAKLDLAAAYAALGRDEDTIAMYKAISQDNPKQFLALKLLGDLYKSKGDLHTAIAYYERALETNHKDPRPYFLLGDVYLKVGEEAKALRVLLQAQRFSRFLGQTYGNIGAIYLKRKDLGQAFWYLSRAADRRPMDAGVHYNFALVLEDMHQRERARDELVRAKSLAPADTDILFALAGVLLRLGQLEEAEKQFEECARTALENHPRYADAIHNLKLIDELKRRAKQGEIRRD